MLYVIATPIGNLGDFSLRAIATLKDVDKIACEDTRVTQKLLHHYSIKKPMVSYHDHNGHIMRPKLLSAMKNGEKIALVSDAGTPAIADPGYKLVQDTLDAGIKVIPIPGANAALTALVASGLPPYPFLFLGFLPAKTGGRKTVLESYKTINATLVCYLSPHQFLATLDDILEVMGDRDVVIAREITKLYETFIRGKLSTIMHDNPNPPKGEMTLIIAPPQAETWDDEQLKAALKESLQTMSLKDASQKLAEVSGKKRQDVYKLGLLLQKAD